ncbi:MAG: hypothetical protein ACRESX_07150 [Gammaproteobacteria bacterium]
MIWKVHSEEQQKLLSNSFNAARGRRNSNRYEESTQASQDEEYAAGKNHKSDKKKTEVGSKRPAKPAKQPSSGGVRRDPDSNSKTWNPAEMGDSRIHGVAPYDSRYSATYFGQSSDSADWTDMSPGQS